MRALILACALLSACSTYKPGPTQFDQALWFENQDWYCSSDMECVEECYEKVRQDESIPAGEVECEIVL